MSTLGTAAPDTSTICPRIVPSEFCAWTEQAPANRVRKNKSRPRPRLTGVCDRRIRISSTNESGNWGILVEVVFRFYHCSAIGHDSLPPSYLQKKEIRFLWN